MTLDLTHEEIATLLAELDTIVASDRYFLSPRIQTFKARSAAKFDRSRNASRCLPRSDTSRRERQHRGGAALVANA